MKKTLYIIMSMAMLFAACSRNEKDLFDKSAAERSEEMMVNAAKVFTAADNGWEMIMFPTTSTTGYNLIIKFNADGTCLCAAKNATTTNGVYKEAGGSLWQMIANQGPCLCFDTYNDVLHAFSEPTLAGYTKGVGMKGDFEFLVVNVTDDEVLVKSKKRGTYNLLRRLPSDQNWEAYFDEIAGKAGDMFKNSNVFTANVNGKEYALYNGMSGVFQLMDKGEVYSDSACVSYPFAFTQRGICLMNGFPNREDCRVFDLVDNAYVNEDVTISVGNLNKYVHDYCLSRFGWTMLKKNMPASLVTLVDATNKEIQALSGNTKDGVTAINIGYKVTKTVNNEMIVINNFVVQLAYKMDGVAQTPIDFTFDINATNENLTFSFVGMTDTNTQTFVGAIPSAFTLVSSLDGTSWVASTNNPMNPTFGTTLTNTSTGEIGTIAYSLIK